MEVIHITVTDGEFVSATLADRSSGARIQVEGDLFSGHFYIGHISHEETGECAVSEFSSRLNEIISAVTTAC